MLPERFKRPAVFLTNSTGRFVNRVVRGSHVINQVIQPVELSIASSTLVPGHDD